MGCCISTKTSQDSEQKPNPPSPNHHHFAISNTTQLINDPPHFPLEEETVKEVVLSETHTTKPADSPSLLEFNNPVVDPKYSDSSPDPDSVELNHPLPFDLAVEDQTEENSEFFSGVSDFASVSASTTTATTANSRREKEEQYEEEEEEEEVMSQKLEKPVLSAKDLGRKAYSGNVAQNRTREPLKQKNNLRRGNVGPTGFRPVSGVRGGRGSRSPALSGGKRSSSNLVGRSLSMGVRSGVVDVAGRLKSPADKEKPSVAEVEEQNDSVLASESVGESLENPVVSLECFIFL
ncbi:hypothetical protein Ancab_011025 [Ancistrocladus abbreviatus]